MLCLWLPVSIRILGGEVEVSNGFELDLRLLGGCSGVRARPRPNVWKSRKYGGGPTTTGRLDAKPYQPGRIPGCCPDWFQPPHLGKQREDQQSKSWGMKDDHALRSLVSFSAWQETGAGRAGASEAEVFST